MPRAESVLFLHTVTGLTDIEEIRDPLFCFIGVRARSGCSRNRVFIEFYHRNDPA